MRRQIQLGNDVASELAGTEDAVLREVEQHVDCEVFLRGDVVTLDGSEEAVTAAEEAGAQSHPPLQAPRMRI